MTLSSRRLFLWCCLALAAGLLVASSGPLRLTWTNDGVEAAFPRQYALTAAIAACAVVAAVTLASRTWGRLILILLALVLSLRAANRAVYRLEIGRAGLSERSLRGSLAFNWPEITEVAGRADAIEIRGRDGRALELPAALLAPEDRSTLERTLARRVRESQRAKP